MEILDANGTPLKVGCTVKALSSEETCGEYESRALKRVLAIADDAHVVLEWDGGSRKWPAKSCRVVG